MFRALLEILQEEIQIYRSLVDLLQEEQEGLIQAKIDSIEEVEKKKENVLLKIRLLEESRIGLIQKIRSSCGLSEDEMTLGRIIQVADQRYKKDLGRCQADLRELVTTVSNLSRMNQRLVGHSLDYLKGSLTLLNQLTGRGATYQQDGHITAGDGESRVINQKA